MKVFLPNPSGPAQIKKHPKNGLNVFWVQTNILYINSDGPGLLIVSSLNFVLTIEFSSLFLDNLFSKKSSLPLNNKQSEMKYIVDIIFIVQWSYYFSLMTKVSTNTGNPKQRIVHANQY